MSTGDAPPSIIGSRYQLYDLIGAGGMGTVYRGNDTQTGQMLAIKLLRPEIIASDPAMIERFICEAEALRQLNHPNIVKVLDTLQEDSHHFIVMEYVVGGSLHELLHHLGTPDHAPLPINQILAIALELADALTRAHHLKIIHRDLKPGNVLLAKDGTIRLSDFGIAHMSTKECITGTGIALGTLDYMPPEAFNGESVDARGDLWAFGVMLFEMLTGQRPFVGNSLAQVVTAILTEPAPDLQALRPDCPVALIDLVARMMEKDPHQRIPSARLVGAALEAVKEGGIVDPSSLVGTWRGNAVTTLSPATAPPKHNLPVQTTPFVGREHELAELMRLLNAPQLRLISILAPGGMGKTRLALEAAQVMADSSRPESQEIGGIPIFPNGVYFIPLAPLSTPENIVPAIAEKVGFQIYQGSDPRQQLLEFLRQKTLLLVMDNFEHLLDGADITNAILHNAPKVKAILTSRERLNLSGETIFYLGGMETPDRAIPEDALEYSAVKLFVQSARRVQPRFEPQPSDLKHISRICQLVQGIPLGILLAAAWVEMISPAEIAAEIERNLDFLTTAQHDVPERQRSIRAVFEHSWNLLNEEEQQVFMKLSVFRGGFTREAAQTVTGAGLRQLAALVNKSLLHRKPDTGRYEGYEMLSHYAYEKLTELGETDSTQNARLQYFTDLAEGTEPRLLGPEQKAWLFQLKANHDNFRASLDWVLQGKGDAETGLRLAVALWEFWRISGYLSEGSYYLEALMSLSDTPLSASVRARALVRAGWLEIVQGDLSRGEALAQAGLSLASEIGDRWSVAYALNLLGTVTRTQGDYTSAMKLYGEALAVAQQVEDRRPLVLSLANQGVLAFIQGDDSWARARIEEVLPLYQQIWDPFYSAALLNVLGRVARRQEDYPRAVDRCLAGLAGAEEYHDRWGIALGLSGMAGVAGARGKLKRAAQLFGAEQALREALKSGLMPGVRADHEQTMADVQAQMSEAAFATAWAEGYAMSMEQAIAFARRSALDIAPTRGRGQQSLVESLSERELEVLRLLAVGMSNQDIAQQLVVTDGTIKRHTHSIFAKLGVRNRTQALLRAKELDLI